MLVLSELGRRLGQRRFERDPRERAPASAWSTAPSSGCSACWSRSRSPAPGRASTPAASSSSGSQRHRHRLAAPRSAAGRRAARAAGSLPPLSRHAARGVSEPPRPRRGEARAGARRGVARRDLEPGRRRVPGPGGPARDRRAAARAERDDRHHDHAHDGRAHARAGDHLRAADRARADLLAAGRLRDGRRPRSAAGRTRSDSRPSSRSPST